MVVKTICNRIQMNHIGVLVKATKEHRLQEEILYINHNFQSVNIYKAEIKSIILNKIMHINLVFFRD